MSKIEKIEKYIILYDLYKNLLTSIQQEIFESYYFEDNSLSEIAKLRQISRAAINDSLKKTIKQLYDFENKISFYKKISILEKQIKK